MSFGLPTSVLRSLASGGQIGLCGGFASSLKRLSDSCGISRIWHAAQAFLRFLVKNLKSEMAVGISGGGRRRRLKLLFGHVLPSRIVYVGAVSTKSHINESHK